MNWNYKNNYFKFYILINADVNILITNKEEK